jgi:hypothetical protein
MLTPSIVNMIAARFRPGAFWPFLGAFSQKPAGALCGPVDVAKNAPVARRRKLPRAVAESAACSRKEGWEGRQPSCFTCSRW